MRSERQRRIEELFGQLTESPIEERERLLDELSDEDRELRAAVEALLRSDDSAGSFLFSLVAEDEDAWASSGPISGRVLGPYVLQTKIGEGGMGSVYLADRADASFRRPVVVKVVRQGMESSETLRQMRLERQILAGLEHPNIARLYDGGTTDENLPYFVMEWVEGIALDEHCDQRSLSIRERVILFRKVCAAVQYAHQNLVVHRDLKPGNILVTAEGEPKLLDFGIAKLLDPASGEEDRDPTVVWGRRMTPSYASPEQISGRKITTASDVYSLGVVLYELLTGRLPRRFDGCSALEIERELNTVPPEKPSEQLREEIPRPAKDEEKRGWSPRAAAAMRGSRPGSLRRELAGDLDRIVLEALHTEPSRRYSSAEQLGDDLGRYLEGLPVRARTDSLLYRMSKFVRRNRIAVAAAGLVMAVLASSSVALTRQATRLAQERDQLRAVVSFVKSVFNVAGEGEDLSVREAVDRSAVVLDLELQQQPEIRAALLDVTGTIYLNLLKVPQARAQLIKAIDLRSQISGDTSLAYAESLSTLGVADSFLDDHELGESRARQALAIFEERLGERHPGLILPLNNLVNVLCFKEDFLAAEQPSARALELARELLGEERVEYGDAVTYRALVFTKRGEHRRAETLYRKALDLHRKYRGEKHPKVTTVLNNLALSLKRQGKLTEAEELFRQSIELQRELFGDDHAEVVVALNNLASLQLAMGQTHRAAATYRDAVDLARKVFGPGRSGVLITTTGLAQVLIETGEARSAEALLRDGLGLWTESLRGTWYLAYARSILGESLVAQQRFVEAEPLLRDAYTSLREDLGDDASKTVDARNRLEAWVRASETNSSKLSALP